MGINTTLGFAFDQETISSTSLGLVDLAFTQAQVDEANRIIISVRSGSINIRFDGTVPTVAIGLTLVVGIPYEIVSNPNIQNLQMIRNGGTDAVIDVQMEK
jgi:hypothetical protein